MSRRVRTVLKVTGAAVAVLALAVACWIEANNDDLSPPDTSDLVPDAIQVAVEDNAYTHFRAAFKSLDWPKNDRDVDSMYYGETWDDGFVIDLLARNGPALALLNRGLRCTSYELYKTSDRDKLHPSWQLLRISKLMALKASQERRAGRIDQAWETCSDLFRFGSFIALHPQGVIEHRAGLNALERACDETRRLLQDDRLDDVRSLALLHQLNRMGPLARGWIRVVKAEFQFVSEAIDREIPGRPGRKSRINGYMFQPERTRQAFAVFCRMMIGNGTRPYGEVQLSAGEPNPPEGVRKLLLLLRPNGMAGTVLPASDYLNRFLVGMYEAQGHLDGLRTILACRLYEIRNGRLPATLETLVPEYLPEVPRDPFDGKPFRYLRGQARVYSVGRDLKDSQVDNVGGPGTSAVKRPGPQGDDRVYAIHPDVEQ